MNNFRLDYTSKMARLFLYGMWAHVPVHMAIAWWFKTEMIVAIGLTSFICLGATIAYKFFKGETIGLVLQSVSLMLLGGVMIHLGRGMIEFHFHVFISLAVLPLFGSIWPVVAGLLTVAVHHIGVYFILPTSLFNYAASFWMVILHAVFAATETAFMLFMAIKTSKMIDLQGETFGKIVIASATNKTVTQTISEGILSLNNVTNDQLTAVDMAISSLDEISAMMEKNVKIINDSHEVSGKTKSVSFEMQNSLEQLRESMNLIQSSNTDVSQKMTSYETQLNEIQNLIHQIADSTQIINSIVFQTKLLSFNASVEAARAGEHGKGFSVVAQEVAHLAETSKSAASDIDRIIQESIQKVQTIATVSRREIQALVEESNGKVKRGQVQAEEIIKLTSSICHDMTNVEFQMGQAVQAIDEQKIGLNQIQSSIKEIHSAAQETSAQAKKIESSGLNLEGISKSFEEVVHDMEALLDEDHKKAA